MKKIKHKIKNQYDAYCFLHDHPKFTVAERIVIDDDNTAQIEQLKNSGELAEFKLANGKIIYSKIFKVKRYALDSNLDIFYTKVDKNGHINENKKLNKHIACWLEFGPSSWATEESAESGWINQPILQTMHDYRLDCGAKTFDKALIKLAKLVRKYYGDYNSETK